MWCKLQRWGGHHTFTRTIESSRRGPCWRVTVGCYQQPVCCLQIPARTRRRCQRPRRRIPCDSGHVGCSTVSLLHCEPVVAKRRWSFAYRWTRVQYITSCNHWRQCASTYPPVTSEHTCGCAGSARTHQFNVGGLQRMASMCGSAAKMGCERQRTRWQWIYTTSLGFGQRLKAVPWETPRVRCG